MTRSAPQYKVQQHHHHCDNNLAVTVHGMFVRQQCIMSISSQTLSQRHTACQQLMRSSQTGSTPALVSSNRLVQRLLASYNRLIQRPLASYNHGVNIQMLNSQRDKQDKLRIANVHDPLHNKITTTISDNFQSDMLAGKINYTTNNLTQTNK